MGHGGKNAWLISSDEDESMETDDVSSQKKSMRNVKLHYSIRWKEGS